jgi:anti-sigma factor RsiW
LDCRDVVGKYAEHELGLLEENEDNELREHLGRCPDCSRHASAMGRVRQALDALSPVDPPDEMWDGIAERIEGTAKRRAYIARAKSPAGRTTRRAVVRPAFSVTVAMLVMVFAVLVCYLQSVGTHNPGYVMVPGEDDGGFVALHAGMSAQEPLAQKGAWALAAAVAAKNVGTEAVQPPSQGGAPR